MRWLLPLTVGVLTFASGCFRLFPAPTPPEEVIPSTATWVIDCPAEQIEVLELTDTVFRAVGCGRHALMRCRIPDMKFLGDTQCYPHEDYVLAGPPSAGATRH